MLPTHGRYLYANITKRPDYTWPNGRRLAVYVALTHQNLNRARNRCQWISNFVSDICRKFPYCGKSFRPREIGFHRNYVGNILEDHDMALGAAVGRAADEEDHHPRITVEWGRVNVAWWTHKIRGLHRNDFIMASKTDDLFAQQPVT